MPASSAYRFDYIAANSGADIFLHGLGGGFFAFSIQVEGLPAPGVLTPLGDATLTSNDFVKHVDGTMAQRIHVQNLASFNPIVVDLILFEQPL